MGLYEHVIALCTLMILMVNAFIIMDTYFDLIFREQMENNA